MKKRISNILDKLEKVYYGAITTVMSFILLNAANVVNAATDDPPKIVTGTVALFKAGSLWLLLIIPVGAGFFMGYHALQKSMSDDDAVIADKNKKIKNTLIGAVIAETATGLVAAILAFYA